MKYHFRIATLWIFAVTALLYSCQKDDDTFDGKDNYIAAFALQHNGTSYAASITGNKIEIYIPANIDLTGATAQVRLCELSTISPNPSEITNWNYNQEFTITSYNNSVRNYSYTVTRTNATEQGTVTLLTQADVETFAAKQVSIINGNLIIGDATLVQGMDTIKNLNALTGLTEIKGNLVIGNSFAGKNLDGLSNLKSAGSIYIGTTTQVCETHDSIDVELINLQHIGELAINSAKVKKLSLPALQSAWSIYVNAKSIKALSMPLLKNIYGNLAIQSGTNASGTTANAFLSGIIIEELESVTGSITIQGIVNATEVKVPKLKSVGENLFMGYLSNVTEINIPLLHEVQGKITITNLDKITSLKGNAIENAGSLLISGNYSTRPITSIELDQLKQVNGDFEISNTSITTINLGQLHTVNGQLKITNNESISALNLPALKVCSKLYLASIYQLPTLDISKVTDPKNIEIVSGYILNSIKMPHTVENITLNGGSESTKFPTLDGLEEVTGSLSVSNYTIESIAIPNVKRIGTYSQNSSSGLKHLTLPDLEDIETLKLGLTELISFSAPKVTRIGTLDFTSPWKLTMLNFSALLEITTTMRVWGATYAGAASKCLLPNLNAFNTVTKIGSVDIKWCGNLTDFSGLKNALTSLSAEKWSVVGCKYNPSFQDMVNGNYTK